MRQLITRIRRELVQAYYPSKRSLLVCAVVTIALLALPIAVELKSCLTKPAIHSEQSVSADRPGTDVIATVHAGLGAIIFPIVVFVAGFAGGTTPVAGVPRSEVLLRASYLFPLSFFAVVSTAVFLIPGMYVTLIWTEVILILSSLFALYQVIVLSLDERRLLESGVDLLRDVIRRDIQAAFDERIANNRLLARLGETDSRMEYRLWPER